MIEMVIIGFIIIILFVFIFYKPKKDTKNCLADHRHGSEYLLPTGKGFNASRKGEWVDGFYDI